MTMQVPKQLVLAQVAIRVLWRESDHRDASWSAVSGCVSHAQPPEQGPGMELASSCARPGSHSQVGCHSITPTVVDPDRIMGLGDGPGRGGGGQWGEYDPML